MMDVTLLESIDNYASHALYLVFENLFFYTMHMSTEHNLLFSFEKTKSVMKYFDTFQISKWHVLFFLFFFYPRELKTYFLDKE